MNIKRFFYDFEFEQKGTTNGVSIDVISVGMTMELAIIQIFG